ncbi:hypothetical protein EGW08_017034 [Elysia chlorotica]|uniref:Uncharacterized protein n=1 Tax=Elysia chlorotica TaxID=188477 RepID=A0A3S1BUI1_ELYCH|nr:hypothetical protein EGW08_017034 [Elysia chlorotica]
MSGQISWISIQDKAKFITSFVLAESLQVYRDDASAGGEQYNLRDINRAINRYRDACRDMSVRLAANSKLTGLGIDPEYETAPIFSGRGFDKPDMIAGSDPDPVSMGSNLVRDSDGWPGLTDSPGQNKLWSNDEQDDLELCQARTYTSGGTGGLTLQTEPSDQTQEWQPVDMCIKQSIATFERDASDSTLLPKSEQVQVASSRESYNKETVLSLKEQFGTDTELRQGRNSEIALHMFAGDLKSTQRSNIDEQEEKSEDVRTKRNEEENVLGKEFNNQRYIRRQSSDAQLYNSSSAFEPDKCQHFKSVSHPRKKLQKLKSSQRLWYNVKKNLTIMHCLPVPEITLQVPTS